MVSGPKTLHICKPVGQQHKNQLSGLPPGGGPASDRWRRRLHPPVQHAHRHPAKDAVQQEVRRLPDMLLPPSQRRNLRLAQGGGSDKNSRAVSCSLCVCCPVCPPTSILPACAGMCANSSLYLHLYLCRSAHVRQRVADRPSGRRPRAALPIAPQVYLSDCRSRWRPRSALPVASLSLSV
jgi:hypothetical protein